MRIFLLLVLLSFSLSSCTTKPVSEPGSSREPAGAPGTATAEPDEENMSAPQTTEELKYRITQWIRYYIIFGGHAQKIVASFDEKLKEGLSSTQDMDRERVETELREIDCQVMEINSLTHEMEEKLRLIYKAVLDRKDPALTDWFIERLAVAVGFDTPAQILARFNYVRLIKEYHDSICNDAVCRKADFSKRRLRFPFNPWSDEEALAYRKEHTKEVALFYANPVSTEGSCISRAPQSATPGTNYFGGNLPKGSFSVTYDDGPHRQYTLDILNSWKATSFPRPTFFWLGKEAKKYPEILKTVAQSGSEIACHSYSHPDLGNIFRARSYSDLNKANVDLFFPNQKRPSDSTFAEWRAKTINQEFYEALSIIEKSLAAAKAPQKRVAKFRLPYGSGYNNPAVLKMIGDRGMVHVHWKIDSLDWQDHNPLSVLERVTGQMALKKNGIILFHDIHPQSAKATKLLIQYFQKHKEVRLAPLNEAL